MRGIHRFVKWKVFLIKPFQIFLETIGYILLRNSKNFLVLNFKSKSTLNNYYTLFQSYENYEQYLEYQRIKTRSRLKVFKDESKSIMWTNENNIKEISNLIKIYRKTAIISGLFMGSRSGEEQTLFHEFLGKKSKVFGVELQSDAKSLPQHNNCGFSLFTKKIIWKV